MVSIILLLVFGLVVGLLARALVPGSQPMGWATTLALGLAGSFAGGALGALFTDRRITDLHAAGLIGSVIGAILLLVFFGSITRRPPVSP